MNGGDSLMITRLLLLVIEIKVVYPR